MSLNDAIGGETNNEERRLDDVENVNQTNEEDKTVLETVLRYLGFFFFGLIIVMSLVMVYLSALSFARAIVPLIVKYFVKVPGFIVLADEFKKYSGDNQLKVTAVAFVFGILAFLPLFQLFLQITIQIFTSFFSSLWKNLDINFIRSFISDKLNQGKSRVIILSQFALTIALFVCIIVCLFVEFNGNGNAFTKLMIIGYSFSFFLFGLVRLIIDCWKSIIKSMKELICKESTDIETSEAVESFMIEENNGNNAEVSGDEYDKSCNFKFCNWCSIPADVFDPSEMRAFDDFYKFLRDKDCNIFITRESKWFFAFPILQFIFILIFIILSFVAFHPLLSSIQLILLLFCLPYSLIFNFGIGFYKGEYYEDKGLLRYGFLSGIILLVLALIIGIALIIFAKCWKPPQDHDIIYYDNTTTANYSRTLIPSFCYEQYGSLDITHLAALLMLPRHMNQNNNFSNVMQYAFEEKAPYIGYAYYDLFNGTKFVLLVDNIDTSTVYLVGGGLENVLGWVTELETLIDYYLPLAIDAIVPLATMISDFISAVFSMLNLILGFIFYNINVTDNISMLMYEHFNESYYDYIVNKNIVVVAQGPSSIYMNYIAKMFYKDAKDVTGAFFEWLPYESSVMYQTKTKQKKDLETSKKLLKGITNVYSNSSLIGSYSTLMQRNVKYPNVKSMAKALNVYDSMCMTMAMCSTNDHWVELCNNVLTENGRNGVVEFKKMHLEVEGFSYY